MLALCHIMSQPNPSQKASRKDSSPHPPNVEIYHSPGFEVGLRPTFQSLYPSLSQKMGLSPTGAFRKGPSSQIQNALSRSNEHDWKIVIEEERLK